MNWVLAKSLGPMASVSFCLSPLLPFNFFCSLSCPKLSCAFPALRKETTAVDANYYIYFCWN